MRSLSGKNNPVKRNHTLDRRRGYRSPTDADIRCPFFDDRFFKLGDADVVDDMVPVCNDNDNTVTCDYKKTLVNGELSLCHRYWKEDFNGFTPIPPIDLSTQDQHLLVQYEYIRQFTMKKAEIEARVFLKDENSAWLSDVQWSDFPAIGATAWRQVDDNTIVTTANTSESRLIYSGENANALDDYDFSVKSYVKYNGDGDQVGVVFRHIGSSYYLLQWDGGDNGIGLRLQKSNGQVLYQSPGYKYWQDDTHYKYDISLKGSTIKVTVQDITNDVIIDSFTVVDGSYPRGSFGVYASSQMDAHFYDVFGEGGMMVTPAEDPELNQDIELAWDGSDLSLPIGEYFEESLERIRNNPLYSQFTIAHVEYKILSNNVLETIYFDGTMSQATKDALSKITFQEYDYDKLEIREFEMTISATETAIQVHDEYFEKDAVLTRVRVVADAQRLQDSFYVAINANPINVEDYVVQPTYLYEDDHNIPIKSTIRFGYRPNYFPMEFYTGPSEDTHNKKYTFRGNVLGWHKDEVMS